jgi:hypothetical protein
VFGVMEGSGSTLWVCQKAGTGQHQQLGMTLLMSFIMGTMK